MPRSIHAVRHSGHMPSKGSRWSRRLAAAMLATAFAASGQVLGQLPAIPVAPPVSAVSAPLPGNPTIITPSTEAFPVAAQVPQPAPTPMPAPAPATADPTQPPTPFGGLLSDPRLSPAPPQLGATPVPNQATRDKINKLVQKLLDPESTLDLITGQTRVLVLKDAPFRVQAGDDHVIGLTLV